MSRPNPIRLGRSLNLEDVEIHRHPNCKFEKKCINKAAKKYWRGFSCISCPIFKEHKKNEREKK